MEHFLLQRTLELLLFHEQPSLINDTQEKQYSLLLNSRKDDVILKMIPITPTLQTEKENKPNLWDTSKNMM